MFYVEWTLAWLSRPQWRKIRKQLPQCRGVYIFSMIDRNSRPLARPNQSMTVQYWLSHSQFRVGPGKCPRLIRLRSGTMEKYRAFHLWQAVWVWLWGVYWIEKRVISFHSIIQLNTLNLYELGLVGIGGSVGFVFLVSKDSTHIETRKAFSNKLDNCVTLTKVLVMLTFLWR